MTFAAGELGALLFAVARLPVSIISGFCVSMMLLLLSDLPFHLVILHSIPITLVTMAGFAVNDILDVEKDRKAGAAKPIAKGNVAVAAAGQLAEFLLTCSVGLTIFLQDEHAVYVIAVSILGVLVYSDLSRNFPMLKGVATAVLCCSPLAYGSVVAKVPVPVVTYLCLIVFIAGRELLLDVLDLEGDVRAGIRTIPARLGAPQSRLIGWMLMVLGLIALAIISPGVSRYILVGAILSLGLVGFVYRRSEAVGLDWSRVTLILGIVAVPMSL